MAAPSLTHSQHYTIKEFQLLVRDAPMVPAEIEPFVGTEYSSSADIYLMFHGLAEMPVETFVVLHLNTKNLLVGMTTCSIGSMDSTLVNPRDVFRTAIANLTAGVVFIHNHPSGNPDPSQEDIQITQRLCAAGRIVGIRCLDHIIIGQGSYFSFADEGYLD